MGLAVIDMNVGNAQEPLDLQFTVRRERIDPFLFTGGNNNNGGRWAAVY